MAIIYSYPEKTSPAGGDFLVITDSEQPAPNKNRTKSLTLDNLASYVVSSTSGITGSGTINTVPVFTGATSIGDSGLVYTTTGGGSAANLPLYTFNGSADITCARVLTQDIFCNNITASSAGTVTVGDLEAVGNTIIGDTSTDTLTVGASSTFNADPIFTTQARFTGTTSASFNGTILDGGGGAGTAGQVLSSTGTGVSWISNTAGSVTGTGTTNNLPLWSDGPNGVLSDSKIKYVPADDKMIVSLTSADFEFFTAGRFKTKFVECTQDTMSTFVGSIRTKSMEIGFTSGAGQAPLDVQASNNKAAVFRGGVIIAPSNISNIQVDNSSLIVGAGNNDIVVGSDHCLAVGNGNQIINNADNSFATGVRNVIDGTGAAQPVRSQVFGFENELKGSYSSFIAGGQNHVETGNNGMVLGFNNGTGASPIKGTDAVFAFGAGNSYTSATGQNVFMLGNSLTGANGTLNIGFRNNTSQYPTTDFANGLGETKVVISTGTTTTTNSNAIVITEGGVTRGAGVSQIPRIIMPSVVSFNFANDTAAAAGGIPVGGIYHNAGALRIRIA